MPKCNVAMFSQPRPGPANQGQNWPVATWKRAPKLELIVAGQIHLFNSCSMYIQCIFNVYLVYLFAPELNLNWTLQRTPVISRVSPQLLHQPLLEEVIDGIMPRVVEKIGIQLLANTTGFLAHRGTPMAGWMAGWLIYNGQSHENGWELEVPLVQETSTWWRSIFAKHKCGHRYVTSCTEIILAQSIAGSGMKALWPLNSESSNQRQRERCMTCSKGSVHINLIHVWYHICRLFLTRPRSINQTAHAGIHWHNQWQSISWAKQ